MASDFWNSNGEEAYPISQSVTYTNSMKNCGHPSWQAVKKDDHSSLLGWKGLKVCEERLAQHFNRLDKSVKGDAHVTLGNLVWPWSLSFDYQCVSFLLFFYWLSICFDLQNRHIRKNSIKAVHENPPWCLTGWWLIGWMCLLCGEPSVLVVIIASFPRTRDPRNHQITASSPQLNSHPPTNEISAAHRRPPPPTAADPPGCCGENLANWDFLKSSPMAHLLGCREVPNVYC